MAYWQSQATAVRADDADPGSWVVKRRRTSAHGTGESAVRRGKERLETFVDSSFRGHAKWSALAAYIAGLPCSVQSIVCGGAKSVKHAISAAQLQVIEEIEEFWSAAKGSAIMSRCKISFLRMHKLRQILGKHFMKGGERYITMKLPCGVRMPQMTANAGHRKVTAYRKELEKKFDIVLSEDGKCARMPASEALLRRLAELEGEYDPTTPLEVQVLIDSSSWFKKVSSTMVTMLWLHVCQHVVAFMSQSVNLQHMLLSCRSSKLHVL